MSRSYALLEALTRAETYTAFDKTFASEKGSTMKTQNEDKNLTALQRRLAANYENPRQVRIGFLVAIVGLLVLAGLELGLVIEYLQQVPMSMTEFISSIADIDAGQQYPGAYVKAFNGLALVLIGIGAALFTTMLAALHSANSSLYMRLKHKDD